MNVDFPRKLAFLFTPSRYKSARGGARLENGIGGMADKIDLEQYCQLKLTCPGCGGRGIVPWNRLDRVLVCRSCSSWFRMDHGGRLWEIAVEDRPGASIEVSVRSAWTLTR